MDGKGMKHYLSWFKQESIPIPLWKILAFGGLWFIVGWSTLSLLLMLGIIKA